MGNKTIFANIPIKLIKRTASGNTCLVVVAKVGDKTIWQKVILTNEQIYELCDRLTDV